jgi:hypothetical protein
MDGLDAAELVPTAELEAEWTAIQRAPVCDESTSYRRFPALAAPRRL